jgi:hypothetical protein
MDYDVALLNYVYEKNNLELTAQVVFENDLTFVVAAKEGQTES